MKIKNFLGILIVTLFLMVNTASAQRVNPLPTWDSVNIANSKDSEQGKFEELKGLRRVFVSIWAFSNSDENNINRISLQQQVNHDLKKYDGFQIVSDKKDADFIFYLDASTRGCDYYVVTRGSQLGDEKFNARVLASGSTVSSDWNQWAGKVIAGLIQKVKKL